MLIGHVFPLTRQPFPKFVAAQDPAPIYILLLFSQLRMCFSWEPAVTYRFCSIDCYSGSTHQVLAFVSQMIRDKSGPNMEKYSPHGQSFTGAAFSCPPFLLTAQDGPLRVAGRLMQAHKVMCGNANQANVSMQLCGQLIQQN